MPRDDWGRLAARDRGRREAALQAYEAAWNRAVNRNKLKKKRKESRSPSVACRCGSIITRKRPEEFKDGTKHVRVECAECGRFMKWGK